MSSHPDDRVEAVLRASRPQPGGDFTRRLERRLLGTEPVPHAARRPRLVLRPALAGAGAAGLLATVTVVAGLVGAGPLAGSDQGARAGESCHYVTVKRPGKVPVVVTTKTGATRIEYRAGLVTKRVQRCH